MQDDAAHIEIMFCVEGMPSKCMLCESLTYVRDTTGRTVEAWLSWMLHVIPHMYDNTLRQLRRLEPALLIS